MAGVRRRSPWKRASRGSVDAGCDLRTCDGAARGRSGSNRAGRLRGARFARRNKIPPVTVEPDSLTATKTPPATPRRGEPRPVATPEAGGPPVAPVPMEPPSANRAKGLIAQGNLIGAARAIVEGLKDNPKNSDLIGTIQQLYSAAEAEATNARKAADAAGAKDRPEYADANARLQTARDSSRTAGPENAEAIVREFGAAADLYRTAAARVKTATSRIPARSMSSLSVNCWRTMWRLTTAWTPRRVRRFKPSFTDFPRDLSSTQLTISDIRIVLTPDRQTATVTLTAQYRNTYGKGAMPGASSPRLEAHVAGPTKRRRLDPARIVEAAGVRQ